MPFRVAQHSEYRACRLMSLACIILLKTNQSFTFNFLHQSNEELKQESNRSESNIHYNFSCLKKYNTFPVVSVCIFTKAVYRTEKIVHQSGVVGVIYKRIHIKNSLQLIV